MSPDETDLARHALGLPNKADRSYRNHFVTGPGSADHSLWMGMVERNLAVRRDGKRLPFGGDDIFHLTKTGALLAIYPKESLDWDFIDAT